MSKKHSLPSVAGSTAEKSPGSSSITDNDWHILVWLLHHPFQRICDIALGLDKSDRTIARAVHHLQEQQMVEHVTPSNKVQNRHCWYYLSSRGITFLAQQEDDDPRRLARTWQVDERHLLRLLPRFHHLVQLQQIIQRLIQSAPVALSYAGRQADIRWRWKRDYVLTIGKRQHTVRTEVDAVIVLRRRPPTGMQPSNETEQFFVVFMYLDMGQRDRAAMIHHLRHLLLYRESRERQPYHSFFPLVIVMVESQRQLELWQWAAAEAAKQLRLGKPLLGVITTLTDAQEPQSLWQANWRHLTTNAFCHLQEMLAPMHAAAVPSGIMDHLPSFPHCQFFSL